MHSSVCIKPQFTLTPSSSSKPLFNRFPLVLSCEPHAEVSVAKIRTHYYSDLFAKCFLDVSPTHVYTHISFSKGTLWKLNCVPFSKYWLQGSFHIRFHWSCHTLLIRLMTLAPLFRKSDLHQQLTCVLCFHQSMDYQGVSKLWVVEVKSH